MWGLLFLVSAFMSLVSAGVVYGYLSSPYLQNQWNPNWMVIIGSWVLAIYSFHRYYTELKEETEQEKAAAASSRVELNSPMIRSQWERDLATYVRQQPGCSGARTNDRSVIVASDGHTPLEIDIYIPDLQLGIEADGIRWHDRDAYRRDQRNGTEYSEEMYKERYCARRGIKLIHVWDEDGEAEVRRQIDAAIREQHNKLFTW